MGGMQNLGKFKGAKSENGSRQNLGRRLKQRMKTGGRQKFWRRLKVGGRPNIGRIVGAEEKGEKTPHRRQMPGAQVQFKKYCNSFRQLRI